MAESPQFAGAGRGGSVFSRDLPKEYTIYALTVIFSATAASMADKPTGFKIGFSACLC